MKMYKTSESTKKKLSVAMMGKPGFWSTNSMPDDQRKKIAEIGKLSSKPIIAIMNNIETIYPSLVEAEKQTGCDRKTMRMVANGIYNQCKGYTFKFIQP